MANFAEKFHNLEGDLVRERKKSFFKLLKETSSNSNQTQIDNAIHKIQPKGYQEEIFFVETLVYFRKTAALRELLKVGNREHIKIIMRQKWFIEDAFKDISPVELVNDFFPCVSYSTRLKLLRRISNCWKEDKVDQLFDAVEKRYGRFNAINVLHACTGEKITAVLENGEITLSAFQCISISNKNEEILKIYIDRFNNIFKKPYEEKSVLNSFAVKKPLLFMELLKSKKIHFDKVLSRSASSKIVKAAKQAVLDDARCFFQLLNERALVSELGRDFIDFYKKIFIQSNSKCESILKYIPKKNRWNFYHEAFMFTYAPHKTMDDLFDSLLNYDSIKLLNPSKETIYQWAKHHYKSSNDDMFIAYFPTSESIPLLKAKINVMSDKEKRQNLLFHMVTSCAANKDIKALDELLDYIGTRHKNEDTFIYKRLIDFIVCKTFCNGELTKDQLVFVHKQILLIQTKNVVGFYDYKDLLINILAFAYKCDKEIFKTVAINYIKTGVEYSHDFKTYLKDDLLNRELFIECCKLFPEVAQIDHRYIVNAYSALISQIYERSNADPARCINLLEFPYLVSAIETFINRKENLDYYEKIVIKNAILYHISFPQYSLSCLDDVKIVELVFIDLENFDTFTSTISCSAKHNSVNLLKAMVEKMDISQVNNWNIISLIDSLLLYQPKLLVPIIDKIYSKLFYYNKMIKNYSHLGIDEKICEYIQKKYLDHSTFEEGAVDVLIDLLPEDKFLDFMKTTFNSDKSPEEIYKSHATTNIQTQILKSLKKIKSAHTFLPHIVKYCDGIFIHNSLPSLYSLFYRSPENVLYPYIEILSKKTSISLQKHSVSLTCELFDKSYVTHFFNTANPNFQPLRKHICSVILKYFAKNSSEELFILLKKFLEEIDDKDQQIFSTLVKIRISSKFKAPYIETCWKIFEKIDNEKIKVHKYLDKLLQQLFEEEVLKSLSPLFINSLVNKYFSEQGDKRLSNIDKFAILCLEKLHNFASVFEILSRLNKQSINRFCTVLTEYIHDKNSNTKFIIAFLENWNKYFSIVDSLNEYIVVNIFLKYINYSKPEYSKFIVDYLDHLIYELGPPIFECFKNNLKVLMSKLEKFDQYQLLNFILNYKSSPVTCVLVIQLLTPVNEVETEEIKMAYNNIIQIINDVNEPIVKSSYHIYLGNNKK